MVLGVATRPAIRAAEPGTDQCEICGDARKSYLFVIRGLPVVRCPGCGLVSLNPKPSIEDLSTFYQEFDPARDPRLIWTSGDTEADAARRYVRALMARGLKAGRILLVAPPGHPFQAEVESFGAHVVRHVSVADVDIGIASTDQDYDAVVFLYQLEKLARPATMLRRMWAMLRPGGILLATTPSLDSWSAKFFGEHWTEWRPENLHYFDETTIQALLLDNGFSQVRVETEHRLYSLRHVADRASAFPHTALTRAIRVAYRFVPAPLRDLRVRLASSGMIVTAVKVARRARPLCSIILPVYNEKETFPKIMDALLAKRIPGVDKEIIVVESNSRDGTRNLALRYQGHPEITLILEEEPRGKGHAVRTGLAHATGDIILIQDADLEYDLNDYDALVESLLTHQTMFALGARHGGSWKMRQFGGQEGLSTLLNFGHVFFTTLLNVLYGQRMRDPFTMFKVFRRDCLYGLNFECNRFDFDHELVIKLVRKGYRPLEIPVNYHSRSFRQGKKVHPIRDPLTWLWADLKFRFTPLRHFPE